LDSHPASEATVSLLDALRGAPNAAQPLPWLLTSGQPTLAHFEALRDAGVGAVIDLRDPMEPRPIDEPAELARLGITYHSLPVRAGALDDATLGEIVALLRQYDGTPTLLHCASANRVGGALLAYLILDQGMSEQDAVDAAMRVGLRSTELMDWGLVYARRGS
jgi:protein tyrosine phosphatase (PTP) superfamily phosphohydrolase (DUF442 family)